MMLLNSDNKFIQEIVFFFLSFYYIGMILGCKKVWRNR